MYGKIKEYLEQELKSIEENGLFKKERIITSPQGPEITVSTGGTVLNFCANNYLGLSSHPEVVQAAKDAMDTHGFGMSSVRFICGTQDIHKTLEAKIADFTELRTRYFTRRLLMRMAVYLSLCSGKKTRSFRIH
jgi:glycine C-acetyltransferase